MRSFTVHTGTAIPLRRSDIDTDQIIPGRFCATHRRSGYADGLFGDWRGDPDFVLNQERFAGATVLVAGENFGCGSSREHAVWALQNYGFQVVISPRFADIFRANSLMAGLLTVAVPASTVDDLWRRVEDDPRTRITVDLERLQIRASDLVCGFDLDSEIRARLMAGVDQIAATLRHLDDIVAYERRRRPMLPRSSHARIPPT